MPAGEERRRSSVLSRVGRVRRRLNLEVWLRSAVAPAWVAATVLVTARSLVPLRLAALLPPVAFIALLVIGLRARPRRFTLGEASVIADRHAGAGGLLLTRLEMPVGEWELGLNQRVRALVMPRIAIRRPLGWLALCLVFTLVGLQLPRSASGPLQLNLAAASRVDQLDEKIEALAKEEEVPEVIEAELARLRADLDQASFDATDWEAADSLEKALDAQAAERTAALANAEQAAAELTTSLTNGQAAESARAKREALEQALMKLADQPPAKDGEPSPSASGSTEKSPRTASSAEAIQKALEKRREALAKSFGQDTSPRAKAAKASGLSQKPGDDAAANGTPNGEHASHGTATMGGPSHGDAPPAELIFGDEATIDPDRLKFAPLPEGHGGDEPGELLGLLAADPTSATGRPVTQGTGASTTGDQLAGHREGPVLPRNRVIIERYFKAH